MLVVDKEICQRMSSMTNDSEVFEMTAIYVEFISLFCDKHNQNLLSPLGHNHV